MNRYANEPKKISLTQIEEGERILQFLKEFQTYRNQVSAIVDSGIVTKLLSFENQLSKYEDRLNEIERSSSVQINKAFSDLQGQINGINSELNTFRKIIDPITMNDLDKNIRDLLASLAFKLDYIIQHIGEIPDIDDPAYTDEQYIKDMDGKIRAARWQVYFMASTSSIVKINEIPGFNDDLTKVISNEDFYGKHYEDGDFSGNIVEVHYMGPIAQFVANTNLPSEELVRQAEETIKSNNIKTSYYVPRTEIDSLEVYPENKYYGTVAYDEEANIFQFAKPSTTKHLFKVVKFFDKD